jgi:mRNA interferase HicA
MQALALATTPPQPVTLIAQAVISVDNLYMTGNEFIRKVKALGKRRGIPVVLNANRGKGSHQTL